LDLWFNFNLFKWNRNIFSTMDANKISFSDLVISL